MSTQKFYTLKQILGMLPVSRSTFMEGVKAGRFPRPIKLAGRKNYWIVDEIQSFIEGAKLTN